MSKTSASIQARRAAETARREQYRLRLREQRSDRNRAYRVHRQTMRDAAVNRRLLSASLVNRAAVKVISADRSLRNITNRVGITKPRSPNTERNIRILQGVHKAHAWSYSTARKAYNVMADYRNQREQRRHNRTLAQRRASAENLRRAWAANRQK